MSTRISIRTSEQTGELPAWRPYTEPFEPDDVLYLEIAGAQVNVTMFADMEAAAGTVVLRLPTSTARQPGLVPTDWVAPRGFGSD